MLYKVLKSADLRELTSFVSPAFFDVMPSRKIWSRGRSLMTTRGSERYREAISRRAQELMQVPLAVQLVGSEQPAARDALGSARDDDATRLVTLYFHQLFSDSPTLLDLRAGSFERAKDVTASTLRWKPSAWVCAWDTSFLASLRGLYRGFYGGDDALFRRSLQELGIDAAEELFRRHFGSEQRGQAFKMKEFVETFHQVFVRCRDAKIELHPDFLALGVYLATLYEHLDGLDVRIDVRACFELGSARPSASDASTRTESPRV